MRRRLLISTASSSAICAALAALSAAGCTPVGEGSGAVVGPIWIRGCQDGKDLGTIEAPHDYDLRPTFFAGEPIGHISEPPVNRLIIRMQRNGNAIQINDTLYVDIPDSFKVAQCVRGSTAPGVPPWDMGIGTINPPGAEVPITTPWCEPAGPAGFPRIHLVPFGPVRVSLTPLDTCHAEGVGPTVVAVTGVAIDGWIDFREFGSAANEANKTPETRGEIPKDFQVAYDDPLRADFHMVVGDDRVVTAMYDLRVPPPPSIGGTLDGFFDFDLKRGRSGQTFP